MDKYIEDLIKEVAQGNPGALTVIRELQWFSRWEKMLRFFSETRLTGGKLWAKVADEYHHDFHAFGSAVDKEMWEYYAPKGKPEKIKGKLPVFG